MKESKQFSSGYLMPVLLLLGLLTLYVAFLYLLGRRTKAAQVIKKQQDNPSDNTIDETLVYKAINNANPAIEPLFLLSIAAHETGEFSSNVFKNNNNLFGMRHPSQRQTLSLGDKNGYAYYSSLEDSVKDFMLWIESRNLRTDYDDISDLIRDMKDNSYFEDSFSNYNNACVKFLNIYANA